MWPTGPAALGLFSAGRTGSSRMHTGEEGACGSDGELAQHTGGCSDHEGTTPFDMGSSGAKALRKPGTASYLAPILGSEGYATEISEKDNSRLKFGGTRL